MEPLSITCTTCNARLRVRDEEALGRILSCPRCGGMVQVPARAMETLASGTTGTAGMPAPNDSGLDLTLPLDERRFSRWLWPGAIATAAVALVAIGWQLMAGDVATRETVAPVVAAAEPPAREVVADAESAEPVEKPSPPQVEQPSDARALDEANHQRTAEGLKKFVAEDGAFPIGAAGATQLPPDERLSWIATLLPYFEHQDWHDALNYRRSWKDAQNRAITTQRLDAVLNPALAQENAGTADAEFPPTHYVGISGIGADAGDLPVDHARAGVFGFQRRVRSEDILDGTSNTIAVLGASGKLGPWSAGGQATVRALTQTPYVNGPDGFGSGAADGVAASMADGSVRFLSKDIDTRVLEQMSTIAGHDNALAGAPLAAPPPQPNESPPATGEVASNATQPADTPAENASTPPAAEEALPAAVAARLADRLLEIDFVEISLADFVEFMSQLSTLEITLDLAGLAEAGVTPERKLSLRQTNTTVREALEAGLAELELSYTVQEGKLIVSRSR